MISWRLQDGMWCGRSNGLLVVGVVQREGWWLALTYAPYRELGRFKTAAEARAAVEQN